MKEKLRTESPDWDGLTLPLGLKRPARKSDVPVNRDSWEMLRDLPSDVLALEIADIHGRCSRVARGGEAQAYAAEGPDAPVKERSLRVVRDDDDVPPESFTDRFMRISSEISLTIINVLRRYAQSFMDERGPLKDEKRMFQCKFLIPYEDLPDDYADYDVKYYNSMTAKEEGMIESRDLISYDYDQRRALEERLDWQRMLYDQVCSDITNALDNNLQVEGRIMRDEKTAEGTVSVMSGELDYGFGHKPRIGMNIFSDEDGDGLIFGLVFDFTPALQGNEFPVITRINFRWS